ncbi:hypothetical protein [Methanosarcina barkeri]|uniref:hypothetical protein n=1 Tax=Methanosarcina barkeri TaxID=2208 RepID=UPI000B0EB5E5|nr:hypothetical protein [Methanosarcina barkeri]
MQNILVIGFDTRNVVCSASRAGYTVCSIDAFCDLDLRECAYASAFLECRTIQELHQLEASRIKAQMAEFGLEFDALVPARDWKCLTIMISPSLYSPAVRMPCRRPQINFISQKKA